MNTLQILSSILSENLKKTGKDLKLTFLFQKSLKNLKKREKEGFPKEINT